jgi:hypothetical protein
MQLILGSSSASRRQILSEMGYQFALLVGDFSPCFQMLDRSCYCFVHFSLSLSGFSECGHRREGDKKGEAGRTGGHLGSCQSNFSLFLFANWIPLPILWLLFGIKEGNVFVFFKEMRFWAWGLHGFY